MGHAAFEGGSGFSGAEGFDFSGFGGGFEDIFENFFGGGGGGVRAIAAQNQEQICVMIWK